MADIVALGLGFIIIDHGRIFFHRRLSEVVDRFADFELVTIHRATQERPSALNLARYGEVVEQRPTRLRLKVKRERVIPVCKQLLDALPVNDSDIQEMPIEDIIRRLFARQG
jgi:ABC-type uncharacterized transport system ATPase subunit